MSENQEVIALLSAAKGVIESKGWTQKAYARKSGDPDHSNVSVLDSKAQCFCTIGALAAACRVSDEDPRSLRSIANDPNTLLGRAAQAFAKFNVEEMPGISVHGRITGWNDRASRTKREVAAGFDNTIGHLSLNK